MTTRVCWKYTARDGHDFDFENQIVILKLKS